MFNLVHDRATLWVAWERIAANRGARTAGVDAMTRYHVERRGVMLVLEELRSSLKDRSFRPQPVRQTEIPKASGRFTFSDQVWVLSMIAYSSASCRRLLAKCLMRADECGWSISAIAKLISGIGWPFFGKRLLRSVDCR